jgi:hypothetical protein
MEAPEKVVFAAALRVFRTPQAAEAFLEIPLHDLGGSPIELLERGRGDEVLAYLAALEQDAPAPPPSMFGIPLGRPRPVERPRRLPRQD